MSKKPNTVWKKCPFSNFQKNKKYESSKGRGKGRCRIITIVRNQKPIRVLNISVPQRDLFLCCQNLILISCWGFRPMKSQKTEMRKQHHFPGHFDGLDQLPFGFRNWLFIKWCTGIINSKLNGIFVSNFFSAIIKSIQKTTSTAVQAIDRESGKAQKQGCVAKKTI